MSRIDQAADAQIKLIQYFARDTNFKVRKNFIDHSGSSFYADIPLTTELRSKLRRLKDVGFDEVSAEESVTYSKFVSERGQANVSYNKTKQRLTLTVNA